MSLRRPAWIATVLFLACAAAAWGVFGRGRRPDSVVVLGPIRELSGIDYRESTGTLWAASDNSTLFEVTLDGRVLRRFEFPDGDTEDVVEFADEKRVWVVAERHPAIFAVRTSDLFFEGPIGLERYPRAESKNSQYEGLALTADDRRLILANERPAALVEMDIDENGRPGKIASSVEVDAESLSAIIVAPDGKEICIASRDVGLRLLKRTGEPLGPWKRFRVRRIEGMAIVPGHGLCLASDTTPGRLSFFEDLDTWEKLRAYLVLE